MGPKPLHNCSDTKFFSSSNHQKILLPLGLNIIFQTKEVATINSAEGPEEITKVIDYHDNIRFLTLRDYN